MKQCSDVIIYIHDATNEILSSSSNYIADIVMWPNFGHSSIFMREVIISQIIYEFVQKTDFEGWSWFKFNRLGLALGTALKFYSSVAKGLKLKVKRCWEELVGGLFGIPPSRSVKTITCSCVQCELTCIITITILENVLGNIKISCFYLRENRGREIVLLRLHVCRCWTSASVRYKILIIRKSPPDNIFFVV